MTNTDNESQFACDEPDTRGPCVVIKGSLISGYKAFGPFDTVDDAAEWSRMNTLSGILNMGSMNTIMIIEKPRTDVVV